MLKRRSGRALVLVAMAWSAAGTAYGVDALLPAQTRVTGGLELLDTKYETTNNNNDFDAQGDLVFGAVKAAINPRFSVGLELGLLVNGQTTGDVKVNSGSGFRLLADADFLIAEVTGADIIGTAGLQQDRFNFSQNGLKLNLTATDLWLGVLIRHRISQMNQLSVHGGLALLLSDQVDVKTTYRDSPSADTDANRQERVNLRLGATVAASPKVDLRLDLLLFGEQSVVLAADFRL